MEVVMNYLKERVSYLKGLAEGMQINDSTNEGKLLKAIIEVLDDVALTVDEMGEVQEDLSCQVDEIDEDLAEIEKLIFDEKYYVCDDDDNEDDDDDEYEEDEIITELECPHCHETINLAEAYMKNNSILCPYCNKEIEVEWSCDCEDCEDDKED